MSTPRFIITEHSIVIATGDNVFSISSTNRNFQDVRQALVMGDVDYAIQLADAKQRVKARTGGEVSVENEHIMVGKEKLPYALGRRILDMIDQKIDHEMLLQFWRNVQHAEEFVQQQLFPFLEHNSIPITADGCFVAYKRVNDKGWDLHTGSTNHHKRGKRIRMKRGDVDPDPDRTCSAGLHVAAFRYADEFYNNGYLWEVKVNPRHVVAVPNDYDGEKMRVCEYRCVKECGGPREEVLYTDDDSYNEVDTEFDDGDFIEENEAASQEEVKPVATIENEQIMKSVVCRTTNGRMTIPNAFIKNLEGVVEGDKLFIICYKGTRKILLSLEPPANGDDQVFTCTVDKYFNVALRDNAFNAAALGKRAKFRVTGYDTHIKIEP